MKIITLNFDLTDSERTTSGPLDEVDSIKQTDKIQINPLTEDAGSATNILLPAILGSVGILGFVAIAIAISIMWSRKKRPKYANIVYSEHP